MVDKGVQKELAAPSAQKVISSVSHKKTSMTDFATPLKTNSDPRISYFNAVNESPTKPEQPAPTKKLTMMEKIALMQANVDKKKAIEAAIKTSQVGEPLMQLDHDKITEALKSSNLEPSKIDEITSSIRSLAIREQPLSQEFGNFEAK